MTEDKPTFESALERIEEIVARLERGEDGLDDSLRMFEQAAGLIGDGTATTSAPPASRARASSGAAAESTNRSPASG